MFEPNQFQSNLRHYGFYIDMSSADAEVDAYASYEEYAKEDSYRVPAQENRIYISAPYRDGDLLLIAYGTPIVYNGSVIGVVISVIDLSSFSSLQISDNNYTSMWSTLYSGDGTIIWDSETLDDVGHNMVELHPRPTSWRPFRPPWPRGMRSICARPARTATRSPASTAPCRWAVKPGGP